MQSINTQPKEPIAIIGIGCRFPGGAVSPEKFWQLLEKGVDAITPIPACRWDVARYADIVPNHGGFIEQVDQFDAAFFRVAPKEAVMLDPQQRLLLEVSWEALEHAGINPEHLRGSDTGVFVGIFTNDYQMLQVRQHDDPHLYISTGASAATASGRIAYFLGLHGPAVSIDTASSSSLVAFHQAVMSVQTGECQMALAAGVNLMLAPDLSIAFARASMLAPDGRSKGFDAAANGYVRGEGCGVVVLKRLSDALRDGDNVLALVRGTAINQDGASQGLTAPSGPSQEAVIRKALTVAGLQPQDVFYIETHGSGTPVGDPVEGNALQAVYGAGRQSPWVVGSVKTNIGHLEAAAGIAGVVKAVLTLQQRAIPPHLHFKQLNPALAGLQAIIPTQGLAWKNGTRPRRAAVSSFGFSGTNAHVILEEAPADLPFTRYALRVTQQAMHNPPSANHGTLPYHLLVISAQNPPALHELAQRYLTHLADNPTIDLADLCYTTQIGRAHFEQRLTAVAATTAELYEQLQAFVAGEPAPGLANSQPATERPPIAFLFTGGGAQYVDMGRELYATQPLFRQILDECDELLRAELGESLLTVLYPAQGEKETRRQGDGETDATAEQSKIQNRSTEAHERLKSKIDEMAYMQPALFAIEYALAKLWEAWGIRPDLVMGHSAGEYAAACLAGVFSFADGLKLIAARGRLMATTAAGAMVALETDEATVSQAVAPFADRVSIGVVNSAQNVVISGDADAIEAVLARLPTVKATRLKITCASHSPLMESILDEFEAQARQVTFARPQIAFVSNVTGAIEDELITTPTYWRRHLRATVRFADGVQTLQQQGAAIFIEIGPKPTLVGMAKAIYDLQFTIYEKHTLDETIVNRNSKIVTPVMLPSLRAGQSDWQQMLMSLAGLYAQGIAVDWANFAQNAAGQRQRIVLPTYPFQHQRYWVATPTQQVTLANTGASQSGRSSVRQRLALANDPALRISFELGQEQPPYLKHYRVFDRALLCTGYYLEVALGISKDMLNTDQLALENVVLEQALVLPADPTATLTLQVVLIPGTGTQSEVQIYSLTSATATDATIVPTWTRHATGQLRLVGMPTTTIVELATLHHTCPEQIEVETFYAQTAARHVAYQLPDQADGPTYQVLQELWRGVDRALGRLQLEATLASEAELFGLHSMLIEGGVQVALAAFPPTLAAQTYLPISLEQLSLYRAGGTALWAYATLQPLADGAELVRADVTLLDEAGVIARLVGLTFKQTNAAALFHPAPRAEQGTAKASSIKLSEQLRQTSAEQWPVLLEAFVQKQVRLVLGLRTGQPLAVERPLKELGLDSLMTTDLKDRLERELKLIIPSEQIMQSEVNTQSLSGLLLEKLHLTSGQVASGKLRVTDGAEEGAGATNFVPAVKIPPDHSAVPEQSDRKVMLHMHRSVIGLQAIGAYIPETRESNFDKKVQFALDDRFIRSTLGIEYVTRKLPDEETSDMCVKAFQHLQAQCAIDPQAIDCLVVVTQNPDGDGLPHTSAIVHGKLGISARCAAFDISLGCSGYVYALSIVTAFMQQNHLKNGLLFTADPYSKIIDPADRDTTLLFGDVATVTWLTDKPQFVPTAFAFGTRGQDYKALTCTDGKLSMNGRAVFDFSAREVPRQIQQLLTEQNRSLAEIDLFLLHQGSKFIVETIRRRLEIAEGKVPINLREQGNTISSSIPLLLGSVFAEQAIKTILLSGFGMGLSWASAIIERV